LCGRADITEPQLAFLPGGGAFDPSHGVIEVLKEKDDFLKHDGARWSKRNGTAGAREQFHAESAFEFLNGAADGGLRDVKPLGRS